MPRVVVQLLEGDAVMERDKLVDHIDGSLLGLVGVKAVAALEGPGNEMQRGVQETCRGSSAFDDCPIDAVTAPEVAAWTAEGFTALDDVLTGVPADVAVLARSLGELRLLAQGTFEIQASFTGPSTSVVVDYRLDDRALETLAVARDAGDFAASLSAYLQTVEIDRDDSPSKIESERVEIQSDIASDAEQAGLLFQDYADQYRRLLESEYAALESVGLVGANALEVRFSVDANNRPVYEDAAARSLPEARADIMRDTFSNWRGQYREAGYPESLSLFARGPEVAPIDGGLFDVDGIPVISEE